MTKSEAKHKIEHSLSQGAQLITPEGKAYEVHLNEVVVTLFKHLIDPLEANIVSACFPQYSYGVYKMSKVWSIAHMGNSWLLTLDTENDFALGFGNSVKEIKMYGFSSSDAVAEWCA